jgi:hypothetical protein
MAATRWFVRLADCLPLTPVSARISVRPGKLALRGFVFRTVGSATFSVINFSVWFNFAGPYAQQFTAGSTISHLANEL